MPDIQIETGILDTADLCPKPNKNVGRKAEKKKGKREIKAAAADSCEQRIFPRRAVTHLPLFASYNMDASNTRWQEKLSHKSTQRMKFSVL